MPPSKHRLARLPAVALISAVVGLSGFMFAPSASAASAAPALTATTSPAVVQPGALSAADQPTGALLPIPTPAATGDANTDVPNRGSDSQPAPAKKGPGLSIWEMIGVAAILLVSLVLAGVATTTLWWMLHAWRTPDALLATRFTTEPAPLRRRFSLIVPARHEEAVLGHTLDTIAAMDHPDFEILAVVGHDDPETELVAREAADRHPGLIRVLVDDSVPKNKPKALNLALEYCDGNVIGVFDAEDEVHAQLLRRVDNRFTETGADVVQAGVQLMNVHTSWWALRNVLEYYFWFRSRLHFHADQRFIPLGGNTVFMDTALLRTAGGWDDQCLAEDCEVGVRLSTMGARVAVAYDPEVVTREETPGSLKSLLKQRTRWDQGFLQVLRKGEWRKLPTRRQRLLARYTLAMPFLQAFTGLLIPLSVVAIFFLKVPTVVALLSFVPLVPTIITVAVEAAGLGEFARSYGVKVRFRDYARLVIGTLPYQIFLAVAAIRSVYRQARGDSSWEKTEHANLHRQQAPDDGLSVLDLNEGAEALAGGPASAGDER